MKGNQWRASRVRGKIRTRILPLAQWDIISKGKSVEKAGSESRRVDGQRTKGGCSKIWLGKFYLSPRIRRDLRSQKRRWPRLHRGRLRRSELQKGRNGGNVRSVRRKNNSHKKGKGGGEETHEARKVRSAQSELLERGKKGGAKDVFGPRV